MTMAAVPLALIGSWKPGPDIQVSPVSGNGQRRCAMDAAMMSLPSCRRLLLALCGTAGLLVAEPLLVPGAMAQGLGLGLDLGGISVDVGVGGDSLVGVDVGVGDNSVVDLDIGGSGGSGGGGGGGSGGGGVIDLDLAPEADGLALGQESALKAVRDKRAIPLEDILLRAQLLTDGDVIDAQLIAVQDVLLYELKVLGKAGDVSELYFYARSGMPVETN